MQIDIKQPILDKNDQLASELRARFAENKVFVLDLLASPGSGKTSTILATIDALRDEFNIAVIEGDIASNVDAEKIKAQGIPAVQINTGGACHLESAMLKSRRGRAGPGAPRPHHRGKRGQPRVPHGLRPGRERQGHDPVGARGRRQAAQVPRGVPGGRGRGAQQGGHPARVQLRSRGVRERRCASSIRRPPSSPSPPRRATAWRPGPSGWPSRIREIQ